MASLPLPSSGSQAVTQTAEISSRANTLGRLVDRLPPGDYVVKLVKADERWHVEVSRVVSVQHLELSR